jgi:hypothetical protein
MSVLLKGPEGITYPGVGTYLNKDGSVSYRATYPCVIRGRHIGKHLGTFTSPKVARAAILRAQADGLEAKVAEYRAEAARLLEEDQ